MGSEPKLSEAQMIEAVLRYRAGEDTGAIARDFAVHAVTVGRALKRHGVALRSKRDAALLQHESPIQSITRAQWMEMYCSEASGYPSINQLARALGVSQYSVRFALIALKIPIRSKFSYGHKKRGSCFKLVGEKGDEAVRRWLGGECSDAIGRDFGCSGDTVLARVRQKIGGVYLRTFRVRPLKERQERKQKQRRARVFRLKPVSAPSYGPAATRKASIVDIAWAAGFLEAEGYFGNRKHCTIVVHQTNREPLDRLQSIFGGRVGDGDRRYDENPRWNHQWYWMAGSIRSRGIAMTVYPFLSERRRVRILEMIGRVNG